MTTKWNLINLDLVPPPDKLSAEEEGEEKLFFRDVFSPPLPFHFPPRLKRQRVLTMLLHLWND